MSGVSFAPEICNESYRSIIRRLAKFHSIIYDCISGAGLTDERIALFFRVYVYLVMLLP